MNTELQKTICEQLPYGTLKFWDEENPEYIPTLIGIPNNEMLRFSLPRFPGNIDLSNSELKPILRRMDELTEKELIDAGFDSHIDFLTNEKRNPIDAPQKMCDYLSSRHYNWRCIPDELVKYTDEFDYVIY